MQEVENTNVPQEELTEINVIDIPMFMRTEWKLNLLKEKDVIADETLVGPSKVFDKSKYPFCINLTTPENFTIIYKLNIKSALENGMDVQRAMAFYLSRKTWKKDIIKKKKKLASK